jgi:hypothetical protein
MLTPFGKDDADKPDSHRHDLVTARTIACQIKLQNGFTPLGPLCKTSASRTDRSILGPIHGMPTPNSNQ